MHTSSWQTVWILVVILIGGIVIYNCYDSIAGTLTMLALTGAFGGLLYTARESGLELIHRNSNGPTPNVINLGWLADCAYGVAGAFVVFLILPTDISSNGTNGSMFSNGDLFDKANTLVLVKFLALALVGGYGGRSLVDRALANLAREVEDVKNRSIKAEEEVNDVKQDIKQIKEEDTNAMELVMLHFDNDTEEVNRKQLKEAILNASGLARYQILKDARMMRQLGYKTANSILLNKTLPVFEALIEGDKEGKYHRNHGQLGYALWDLYQLNNSIDNLEYAHRELTKAIEIRNISSAQGFHYYEFVRAMCRIKLNVQYEKVLADVEYAATRPSLYEKIQTDPIFQKWAA